MRLGSIRNDYSGYREMIDFYYEHRHSFIDTISLSLGGWFPANTCSFLGALLYLLQKSLNTIEIDPGGARDILTRNGFLSFFGNQKIPDHKNTTISYQMLDPSDDRYFNNYVFKELLSKPDLPKMTIALRKKLAESIYEIFINAKMHSGTEKIFTCGQFFPGKHVIEFMITDIGIGIPESINRRFGVKLDSITAIDWAMKSGHTTKQGVSGGIGLALLQEFIRQNKGKIQVISRDGFWELNEVGVQTNVFPNEFPGTAVNIYVRTDDPASYALVSEVTDIF